MKEAQMVDLKGVGMVVVRVALMEPLTVVWKGAHWAAY